MASMSFLKELRDISTAADAEKLEAQLDGIRHQLRMAAKDGWEKQFGRLPQGIINALRKDGLIVEENPGKRVDCDCHPLDGCNCDTPPSVWVSWRPKPVV